MGVFPSGQWGQTVNLLLSASVVRIHPRPPRTPVSNEYRRFCFICLATGVARVDSNSNSDDRRLRQKQGGAVGAAASRMRVPPKARCSRWEPRLGLLFCAARAIHPRPPRTPVSEPGTGVSVLSDLKENTVHAAQRSFCRVKQRQNPSAVLRDGKFFWGVLRL